MISGFLRSYENERSIIIRLSWTEAIWIGPNLVYDRPEICACDEGGRATYRYEHSQHVYRHFPSATLSPDGPGHLRDEESKLRKCCYLTYSMTTRYSKHATGCTPVRYTRNEQGTGDSYRIILRHTFNQHIKSDV